MDDPRAFVGELIFSYDEFSDMSLFKFIDELKHWSASDVEHRLSCARTLLVEAVGPNDALVAWNP